MFALKQVIASIVRRNEVQPTNAQRNVRAAFVAGGHSTQGIDVVLGKPLTRAEEERWQKL